MKWRVYSYIITDWLILVLFLEYFHTKKPWTYFCPLLYIFFFISTILHCWKIRWCWTVIFTIGIFSWEHIWLESSALVEMEIASIIVTEQGIKWSGDNGLNPKYYFSQETGSEKQKPSAPWPSFKWMIWYLRRETSQQEPLSATMITLEEVSLDVRRAGSWAASSEHRRSL